MEESKIKDNKQDGTTKLMGDEEMIIESSEDLEIVKTFDDLGLRDELLRGKLIERR